MYVYRLCSLIARELINRFAPNLTWLFLETRKRAQEAKTPGNVSWARFPVRAFAVARKVSTVEEWRQCKICFGEEIIGTKVRYPKTAVGSNLCEDFGFRGGNNNNNNNNFLVFNDTYRMMRPIVSFWAIKIGKKCKHLLNFPHYQYGNSASVDIFVLSIIIKNCKYIYLFKHTSIFILDNN
jgi:hypothetical protein